MNTKHTIHKKNEYTLLLRSAEEATKMLLDAGASEVRQLDPQLCRVIRPHLLRFEPELILIFAVPYRVTEKKEKQNISEYAIPRDYHIFFRELFEEISARLSERFPEISVTGASDHSPIDEVHAAASAGLGVIGKNRLLITPKHGSYVFIGELYLASAEKKRTTELPVNLSSPDTDITYPNCIGCGACIKACPSPDNCLSSLTQKKGELSEEEKNLIRESGCAWGCDICQNVCPMNRDAADTSVPFFLKNRKQNITAKELETMSDDEFSSRAYAWRGRKTIARNLRLVDK